MAQGAIPFYKTIDRRGINGFPAGRTNNLFEAAQRPARRKLHVNLNKDTHQNISETGRSDLLSSGRWLFANHPEVRGMLLEQANLAVGTFLPQFYGADQVWKEEAESVLFEWGRIMDWRGWPHDYDTFVQNLIVSEQRDGDSFVVLVKNKDTYPFIQVIPGHRVRTVEGGQEVLTGRYKGRRIIDGAIMEPTGRVIAWRVSGEGINSREFVDVPADVMFPAFWPVWVDQVRGLSSTSSSANQYQDIRDTKANELIAQNTFSRLTLVENNDTGAADDLASLIKASPTYDAATGAKTAEGAESIEAGSIRYFRSGSGGGVQAFQHDRPGTNSQRFLDICLRDAFAGNEWSTLFSVDPGAAGGAALRIITDKINRTIRKRRMMVEKVCRRVHGWAVVAFMELGILPANDEWWKWEYQASADVTADKKYDSDVDVQELAANITTEKKAAGKRGDYWEDNQDQRLREKFRWKQRSREIGTEFGFSEEEADAIVAPVAAKKEEGDTKPNRTRREPIKPEEDDQPAEE